MNPSDMDLGKQAGARWTATDDPSWQVCRHEHEKAHRPALDVVLVPAEPAAGREVRMVPLGQDELGSSAVAA
jgi:hypothetical protein